MILGKRLNIVIFALLIVLLMLCMYMLYSVLFLSKEYFSNNNNKNYICLLSVKPSIKTYNFYKEIKEKTGYNVVIVIDDNNYEIPGYDNVIPIIKIDNKISEEAGYKSSVGNFDNKAVSRDKGLYWFNKNEIDYEYIWFIEEDVFIPTVNSIENLDKKYRTGDLLCRSNHIITEKKNDWWWPYIDNQIKIDLPYSSSMICAIRCSKKMMTAIDEYASKYNNLFMDEALFTTLALHNNLSILLIPELSDIMYNKEFNFTDIDKNNLDKLYHPVKSIDQQEEFRELLKKN
jgi:hypothetical protein